MCNIRRERPRRSSVRCAGGRTTSRTGGAHVCTGARVISRLRLCTYAYVGTYVHTYVGMSMYLPRRYTYPRRIPAEDQPPDPFRRRISMLPFLPLPLFPFFPPFSFPPAFHPLPPRPVLLLRPAPFSRAPSTYLSVSRIRREDSGLVLVTTFLEKKLRKGKNFLSLEPSFSFSPATPSLHPLARSFRHSYAPFVRPCPVRRVPPFYFACLSTGRKGLAGVSFLAGYSGATEGRQEGRAKGRGGIARGKR